MGAQSTRSPRPSQGPGDGRARMGDSSRLRLRRRPCLPDQEAEFRARNIQARPHQDGAPACYSDREVAGARRIAAGTPKRIRGGIDPPLTATRLWVASASACQAAAFSRCSANARRHSRSNSPQSASVLDPFTLQLRGNPWQLVSAMSDEIPNEGCSTLDRASRRGRESGRRNEGARTLSSIIETCW